MLDVINVNSIEDKSVEEKMKQVADKLASKYKKKRKVNEKLMKKKSKPQKVFSLIFDAVLAVLVLFTFAFGISTVNARLQGVAPSFAGISVMRVASGSMTKSGFEIGQTIVIKQTDTNSLKPDDMIAFYTYPNSYYGVKKENLKPVSETAEGQKSGMSLLQFFGVQSKYVQEAAQNGARLTFHHIRAIFEDENGTRWFSTYGSSNASDDNWLIREELVVGKYDGSFFATCVAGVLQLSSSMMGLAMLIMVPVLLLAVLVIKWCVHNVQVAKLELDIVEEKRKLTDEICVVNDVGYGMATETKYKVLAQAEPEEINAYLSLLWRDGSAPKQIRKYYLRKIRLINKMSEILEVNRTCEQMFRDGEPAVKIAKYYSSCKQQIEKDYKATKKQLKKIKQNYEG